MPTSTERRAADALKREPVVQWLLRDIQRLNISNETAVVKADPLKHKLTRLFAPGVLMSYRYYFAGRDGRGRRVLYCYTTHRNLAGFYLGWREVQTRTTGRVKRDQWTARHVKRALVAVQKRRAERHAEKGQGEK